MDRPEHRRWLERPSVVAAMAAAAAFLCFLPSLAAGFVYDDLPLIVDNPHAWSLTELPRTFRTHFWDTFQDRGQAWTLRYYRPLVAATYTVNWVAAGGAPWAFHLFNVLLHAATVFLAARVAARWTGSTVAALAIALVFALHPTRSESVTWIAGRTDVLMALFMLLAVELARGAGQRRGLQAAVFGAASTGAAAAAVLSKEPAALLPFLLWFDWWAMRDLPHRRTHAWACAVPTLLCVGYVVARTTLYPIGSPPFTPTPLHGLMTVGAYVERIVLPWPQTFFHRPLVLESGAIQYPLVPVLLGLVAVALYIAHGVWAWRRDRPVLLLLLAAAGLLGPLLNFWPSGQQVTTSDRFLYLPLLVWLTALARSFPRPAAALLARRDASLAGGGLLIVWTAILLLRSADYASDERFWDHELALRPDNPRALMWVGRIHAQRGDLEGAYSALRRSVTPPATRYPLLCGRVHRLQTYSRLLALAAGRTPDGDVLRLARIDAALEALRTGGPGPVRSVLDDVPLGMDAPARLLDRLRTLEGAAMAAEQTLIATRLGRDAQAKALLAEVADDDFIRLPGPLNLILAHARLGDHDEAERRLRLLAEGPRRAPPDMIEALRARLARARALAREERETGTAAAGVAEALAQAELGAYLRALQHLRPIHAAAADTPDVAPLYVQLLTAARLEQEALREVRALLGSEDAERAVEAIRAQLPPSVRDLPPAPEPSPWWQMAER